MNQITTHVNTGKQLPMVEQTILVIMRVMMTDYGSQYKAICKDKASATAYKNRLLKKLDGFHPDDIADGYDDCTEESPKFMPTIPDLYLHIEKLDKKRKQLERHRRESEALLKLPAPKHSIDVLKVFEEAKNAVKDQQNDHESHIKRLKESMTKHKAVLSLNGKDITRKISDAEHQCNYSGCYKAGAISTGTNGGDSFYCKDHFRLA